MAGLRSLGSVPSVNISRLILIEFALPGFVAGAEVAAPGVLEKELQRELLAPCCYRETLDRHMSAGAIIMKAEIHAAGAGGKSERQIIERRKPARFDSGHFQSRGDPPDAPNQLVCGP